MRLPFGRVVFAALLLVGHTCAFAQALCTVSATPINFGAYTGVQVQVTATIDLTCSGTSGSRADYVVTMSAGNSQSSSNYAQRLLRHSGLPVDTLNYNLYLGSVASSNIWGDGTGGSTRWIGRTQPINPGNPQRVATTNVVGVLAAGTVPSAGNYTDTIVVTATWN